MSIRLFLVPFFLYTGYCTAGFHENATFKTINNFAKSIREFGVLPTNTPAMNRDNLQKAINWAHPRGAAIYVEPTDVPYPMEGGIILRANVSLVGVHGPVGRGTRHPDKAQPVGSVFAIEDEEKVFMTVENATQIRGIQFWYPKQTLDDPAKIIRYPATIQASKAKGAQGVMLSCLTFYGEFIAMDFNAKAEAIVEQILFEHCYGYPLSGEFIRIDYCYDIPRILHCHVNPANRRFIDGGYSRAVIDSVVARKTFTYRIDHTDNAQCIDLFTFGAYGGIYLGPATYGQLTNFNFDCVTVGIHKLGDNSRNRNWQVSQGSIIANTGQHLNEIHSLIVEGQGHMSLTNVEAFSGPNNALTTLDKSQDFLLVTGNEKLTITMVSCRMRDYVADNPITRSNANAVIQAIGCFDKHENIFESGDRFYHDNGY
ncbi:MAG: hypothetical protein A2Y12_18360 [Planctomycetes bacterium GWF2_42_9]|nr:MAG: hypothetical protein A2Y12_18360 [Planctomycetes bacterium GWF2_42_9]